MKTDLLRSRFEFGLIIDLLRCQNDWRRGCCVGAASLHSFLLIPNSLDHTLEDDLGLEVGAEGTIEAPTEKATGPLLLASETELNCKNLADSSVCWLVLLLLLLVLMLFLVLRGILGISIRIIGRRSEDSTLNRPVTRETIFNSAQIFIGESGSNLY